MFTVDVKQQCNNNNNNNSLQASCEPGDRRTPLAGPSPPACSPEGPAQALTTHSTSFLRAWGFLWRSCKNTVSKVKNTSATPFLQERLYMIIGFTARREQQNSNGHARKCCKIVSKATNNTATPFRQERLYLSIGFTTRGKHRQHF